MGDLRSDPDEMVNVSEQELHKVIMAELISLARTKWPDIGALAQRILQSQRRRRMVHSANLLGKRTHWDHQPAYSEIYIRNTGDALQDQEYVCRAPYRGKRP